METFMTWMLTSSAPQMHSNYLRVLTSMKVQMVHDYTAIKLIKNRQRKS